MASGRNRRRRAWGHVRKLPGGRWQASYIHGPQLERWNAPRTFSSEVAAEGWLAAERRLIELNPAAWAPPKVREDAERRAQVPFRAYSARFMADRVLSPKTRNEYERYLDSRLLPGLGEYELNDFTPQLLRTWWANLQPRTTATTNAHAWALLSTILNQAVGDGLIDENPCRAVPGAGKRPQKKPTTLLTPDELSAVTKALPQAYRLAAPVLAWCALRFGELIELRRGDVADDGTVMVLKIRRAAVLVDGKIVVGPPKTDAGIRDVVVPPHLAADLRTHIANLGRGGPGKFVFTTTRGRRLSLSAFTKSFKAALPAGKSTMRVHDLRHTGAVFAAQAGATTAELMSRLGHASPAMAMHYQHVAAGRDGEIAARMSEMLAGSG